MTVQINNYKIQSVLFNKERYTPEQAEMWLIEHDFKVKKIDITEHYLRFRQYNPNYLKRLGYTVTRNHKIGSMKGTQIYLVLCYKN